VLGWVAGDIFADDPVVGNLLGRFGSDDVELAAKIAGTVIVLAAGAIGYAIRKRRPARDRGACRSDAE
jgi:hypothetical protein